MGPGRRPARPVRPACSLPWFPAAGACRSRHLTSDTSVSCDRPGKGPPTRPLLVPHAGTLRSKGRTDMAEAKGRRDLTPRPRPRPRTDEGDQPLDDDLTFPRDDEGSDVPRTEEPRPEAARADGPRPEAPARAERP